MTVPPATSTILAAVRRSLAQVIHGKPEVIELILVGVFGGGHVLIEDVPGVGKTTLAKTLARTFRATCTRVQFTPDLLPSDILGAQVLNPRDGTFSFHRGPIFTNVLLADEINRASPRTQSALLEAMSEAQATVDGISHPLPAPFFVIATQNPVDYQGTYPLPEAQLDRFLLRIAIGYPSPADELAILYARKTEDPLNKVEPVAGVEDIVRIQAEVRDVEVKEPVAKYLLQIVAQTRDNKHTDLGVSPRGALAFFRAVQARALLQGRSYASPDDVQALARPVLAHRLLLTSQARYGGTTADAIVLQIVSGTKVPV